MAKMFSSDMQKGFARDLAGPGALIKRRWWAGGGERVSLEAGIGSMAGGVIRDVVLAPGIQRLGHWLWKSAPAQKSDMVILGEMVLAHLKAQELKTETKTERDLRDAALVDAIGKRIDASQVHLVTAIGQSVGENMTAANEAILGRLDSLVAFVAKQQNAASKTTRNRSTKTTPEIVTPASRTGKGF